MSSINRKTAGETAGPQDAEELLATLETALAAALALGNDPNRIDSLVQAVGGSCDALMSVPQPAASLDGDCTKAGPATTAICAARNLAANQANVTFLQAKMLSMQALGQAVMAWDMAVCAYRLALQQAQALQAGDLGAAVKAYQAELKTEPPDVNRTMLRWCGLKGLAADGTEAYETAKAKAGGPLAVAAGELMSAYAASLAAVQSAEAARLQATCAAETAFWTAAEAARES